MAGKIVADIPQLTELERSLQRQSQQVRELTSQLTSTVAGTVWEGPAAERFRASWERDFKPVMARLEQELEAASIEVRNKKTAIEQAGS